MIFHVWIQGFADSGDEGYFYRNIEMDQANEISVSGQGLH